MLSRLVALLGLFAAWLSPALAQVAPAGTVRLEAATAQVTLSGRMSFLIDPRGDLSLEDAIARLADGKFTLSTVKEIAGGFLPHGAIWIYVRVEREAQAPTEWWLEAAEDLIDDIRVYEIKPKGVIETRRGGRALPFKERELAWHSHAFRLTLDDTAPRDIYLRYASASTLRIAPRFFQPRAYDLQQAREDLILGAYFGIMSIALLISGYRAIRYRSLADIFYALYIIGLETSNFVNLGPYQLLGLSDSLPLRHFLVGAGVILAGLALPGFARVLIAWPTPRTERFDRLLIAAGIAYLTGYLMWWALGPAAAFPYSNAGSSLIGLGILVAALWASWRGYANARFFLIAFTPFILIALARIADSFGLIQGEDPVYYLYLFGSVVHVALLMMVILIRDADQHRAREQMERQVARMREDMANHALFSRMLAHEVRTPLAIIDSYTQLLERRNPAGAEGKIQAARIRSGVRRLSAILERFLRQDRLTSFDQVERVPVDLNQLITSAVAEVQRQTEDHLLRYLCEDNDLHLIGDPSLLRVMLLNLLENAVRYSPEGGAVEVRAYSHPDGLSLEVTDEGIGIPAAAMDKLFERYYRTGQIENVMGAGLGLYIVRSISCLHGGEVSCESTLGEGSTFRVNLRCT